MSSQGFTEGEENKSVSNLTDVTRSQNKASPRYAGLKTLAAAIRTRPLGAEVSTLFTFEVSKKETA